MKKRIFEIIDTSSKSKSKINRFFAIFIVFLICTSVIEIILESYESLRTSFRNYFYWFELITVLIFSTEYLLRVWTADLLFPEFSKTKARLKFIFSPFGLIDLLAILPFYLPFIFKFDLRFVRILRIFRLLRIFKLNRYSKSFKLVGNVFRSKWSELTVTLLVTFLLILLSSAIMYHVEHEYQPKKFPNIIETFWWAVATLTTIGYGDVVPITGWGKFLSAVIALLGIGVVALPTGILSAAFTEELKKTKKKQKNQNPLNYCPNCGEKLNCYKD